MVKRDADLQLVTCQHTSGDFEHVLWADCQYDRTLQLPVTWKLSRSVSAAAARKRQRQACRVDRQRLKNRSEDDDGIPDIDEGLKHRLDAARPAQLHIYCSHKGVMFKASISAADVASKLDNGHATLEVAALPMSKIIGPKEDDISGVSAHGELVNIDPTSARQTFFAPSGAADSALENSLSAHPLELSRRSLSGELVLPPPEPTYVSRNVKKLGVFLRPGARAKVAAAQPSNGGSGGGAEKEDEEEMDADDGNALLQLMGFAPGPAPGLRLTLDIALYLLDPRSFLSAVKWQQKQGLLPQSGIVAAWTLSSGAHSRTMRAFVPWFLVSVLLWAYTLLYLFTPVRHLADAFVARFFAALPARVQSSAAGLWHFLLPDWVLRKVAPTLLQTVLVFAVPIVPILLVRSSKVLEWWLRRISMPASGHGSVYGMTVVGGAVLSEKEVKDLQSQTAERPDLSDAAPGTSDDKQERFWKDADFDAAVARKSLRSDAQWRKSFNVDNIFKIKHPNFLTLKKAFPHGIIAMSTCGHAVFAMKMGVLHEQYSQIEEAGLSNDDIVKHLALVYEYAFCKLDPKPLPGGQLINVLDFDGLGIMDMRGKASKLGNLASKISKYHYPDRLHRAMLINCPGMINQVWGIAKGMLDENARKRTSLYTKKDTHKGMKEILADDQIPKEWGGSRETPFYNGEEELGLFRLVAEQNGDSLDAYAIEGYFEPPKGKAKK